MNMKNIWHWFEDFLYGIKTLMSNDYDKFESLTFEMDNMPCKCEKQPESLDTDFYIEEWFHSEERKVTFSVIKITRFKDKFNCGSFDTLTEAKEHLNNLRKYKTPIIHRY